MYNCVTCKDTCNMSKQELFNQIQALAFAINDLALYLDTHVDDKKALDLHNEYARKYRKCYDEYERRYGMLSIFCPCDNWKWINTPWPWQNN